MIGDDVDWPLGPGLPAESSWPAGSPIDLRNVVVRRGSKEILRGVTARIEPGRRHVLIGPSGAGKTTLMRLLNRLDDPTSGLVEFGGIRLDSLPVPAVRRAVGFVFQNPSALPGTVRENLSYPWAVRGLEAPDDDDLAARLATIGLDPDWLARDAGQLSGGERQRLSLLTALGTRPEILAMDEPTSGLDPESARKVASLLDACASAGLRTIVVTHHREHARWLGDWGLLMRDGLVLDDGPIDRLLEVTDAEIAAAPGAIS